MHPPEDYYVKQEKKNAKEIILKKEKSTYEKSLFWNDAFGYVYIC